MADLGDLVNIIGQQNTLSGIQDAAKQFGESGMLDPQIAQLIQDNPRLGTEIIPQLMQQKIQMSALAQLQQPQQPQQQQPALPQGVPLDADTALPIQQAQPQQSALAQVGQTQPNQPSALGQLQQALVLGRGNLDMGMKILEAQRTLAVPPGAAPPPSGQQYVNGQLQTVPGAITEGQKDRDKDFADVWTPFKNTGGATNAASQIKNIQGVIDDLNAGKIETGPGTVSTWAFNGEGEPSPVGRLLDTPLLGATAQVMKAVLPSSKALFGPRVTQKEVSMNVQANGINPYMTREQNISNLETLKNNLSTAISKTQAAGEYFDQHGTLAGYQGDLPQGFSASAQTTSQPQQAPQTQIPSGITPEMARAELARRRAKK